MVSGFPELPHNYPRKAHFSIWFTLITVDNERIECILDQICSTLSLDSSQVLNLPMKRLLKLNARFSLLP
ncbi:MAG: hypothetical protein ACYS4T_14305 [Planctomycetota bacterium]